MAWVDRQLPQSGEVFLDHVGFFVADMDAAARGFERLGFTVSEQNTHFNANAAGELVPAGTVNRLITFGAGYLEVLAASADTPLAAQLRQALQRYPGLHLIAFGHADVSALEPEIRSAGIELQPTVNLRRPIETPEGEAIVAFTVLRAAPGAMAEGRVQFCQHLTPEHVWRPGMSDHANAVDALTEMLIVAEDVGATVRRYERFARRPGKSEDGAAVIELDRGRLSVVDGATAKRLLPDVEIPSLPYCAGVALRSTDLDRTRAALARSGVSPVLDRDGIVAVGPADGLGAWVLFTADTERPALTALR